MVYDSSYKDLFYLYSGETLDYGLYLGTAPLFYGRAIRRPGDSYIRINVSRICQDSLDAGFPFSSETGLTYGEFSLYRMVDGEPAALLDEYGLLLAFDRDLVFEGDDLMLSEPINGRADSRMKMVYSVFKDTTGETVCEDYRLYKRMTIEPNVLYVGSGATAATLTIISNYDYDITVNGSPDWVTLSQSSGGSGTTVLTVSVGANPDYSKRRAIITVDKYQIPLIQEAKLRTNYRVTPASITLPALSGTSSITVLANADYHITDIPNWIHFESTSGTAGVRVHTFTYDTTDSFSSRTATITVETETVTITQGALYINVSPSVINSYAQGGIFTISVSSNTSYTATTSEDWISLSPATGNGNGTIRVTLPEHTGGEDRTATITIGNQTISVLQYAVKSIDKQYLTMDIISSGTIVYKSVNFQCPISYSKNLGDWVQINPETGTSVSIQVAAGDDIRWKGTNDTYASGYTFGGSYFTEGTAHFNLRGNPLSLIYGASFESYNKLKTNKPGAFRLMFNNTLVHNTGNLYLSFQLERMCFMEMFKGCTYLTEAPVLDRAILYDASYAHMFEGCTSLVNAPSLSAVTTTAYNCCGFMFEGCTSLVNPPELPSVTSVSERAFRYMFRGCTSLVNPPELPATTLGIRCYEHMFEGCTSLTAAPALPATTLKTYCYSSMFRNCSSITSAPALSATTLLDSCYYAMFSGCTNLSSITCLATTGINSNYSTSDWLTGVSLTGTFTKKSGSTWPTGNNGIPDGWTAIDI